ncbi:hypothetical protein GobsT_74130 [Gemmata obscuriglobus]|nr:hypothetical protein GobsT_74130 [Gemmata obscuriglobus]VTS11914.1 unnamed protein product [Gemmata obscuriglobus UQM 2246]
MTSNRAPVRAGALLLYGALACGCGGEQPPPPSPPPAQGQQAVQPRVQPKTPKNVPPGGNKME